MSRALRFFLALVAIVAAGSCTEATGPETIDAPSRVSAVLASPTSARVTWTASPQVDRVASYNVFRNGTKVADVPGTTYLDGSLVELTTYKYTVSANGRSGIVSALSAETASSAVIPPDVTPPQVTATTPAAGAVSVPRASAITVTFSEAMSSTTISSSSFIVKTGGGADIAGAVTYNPATRTALFTPTASLPNATSIPVSITTAVRDAAGNAMAAPFNFSFTVRDETAAGG